MFGVKNSLSNLTKIKSVSSAAAVSTFSPIVIRRNMASLPGLFKSLVYSSHNVDDCASILSLQNYKPIQEIENSIVLRMLAFPINPSDINQLQGVYPSLPNKSLNYQTLQPAAIAGNEGVYEVIHVPNRFQNLKKGDWVIPTMANTGTWTNYQVFYDESQLIKVNGLDLFTAATIGVNGVTAYQLVNDFVDWKRNENNWLIQNAGNSTVSKMVSQIAKVNNVKTLSVVRDRKTPEQFNEMAKMLENTFGTTKVISESQNNDKVFGKQELPQILGKDARIRLALNSVGGKSSSSIARKLEKDGLMLTYGGMSKQPVTLPTSLMIFKNITSAGYWVTELNKKNPQRKVDTVHDLINLYEAGEFVSPKEDIETLSWDTEKFNDDDVLKLVQGGINSTNGKKKVVVLKWD
ncbi:similar to Saccharomyces cerevisiae YBR026C ETR1 2-enoyl thioester reductase, member of the medium chain dehydrogenase/reductase family [Maudiozyma barnettii]|uniref:Similar to Saccharomyces cerevisiae YBR026C ETR1 2-enoyl thioester reductase, member of the medium chain dehydrogenase/reductase family n=1 Tax=Maudiozyma barnettii TaxID=61262 RepID=A0A8H2VDF0_9SACH|nr:enoyl-[acyl-carrier-protein] reductase [Kazachstania barnettii]CAB4253182.1 similar to Saccharomyces cerevisiae YBR026C ETR1 2-enoyl thioester reductase, member of the medium chain dehydrogenase/reductase family [Kazachstania barnettii]CAD1780282.1 similar to Saccharomyces cerevisiae YBR026C ETR1 2-enoyl thioester reductase, member of the medium chain dehydrogenase/reductase family [Kazachstania barnettii]